jgi:hypothetical protein
MLSESRLQYEIVQWAQREGYFCFHCPNGEKREPRTANKLMAMGVKAGVPDLIFILPEGKILWVELKLKNGKLSKPQEKFITTLSRLHHPHILIKADCLEEAVNYLAPELSKICHPE